MTILSNLRLSALGWIIAIILFGVALLFIAASVVTIDNIQTINTTWEKFEQTRSEKARALGALRREIGYGGAIHQFKNYIIRHEPENLLQSRSKLGGALAAIAHYRSLDLSADETKALNDIQATVRAYRQALTLAESLVLAGQPIERIDRAVRVDDSSAIAGFKILRQSSGQNAAKENIHKNKADYLANLHQAMGYGGMIHNFKNAVLRGEARYFEKLDQDFRDAFDAIAHYRELGVNPLEREAVDYIDETITKYQSTLPLIKSLHDKDAKVSVIDNKAKVSDSLALLSFDLLSQEIIRQNDKDAKDVSSALQRVKDITSSLATIGGAIMGALGVLVLVILKVAVIAPIKGLTETMSELAENNLDIVIHGSDKNNEMGEMARAVQVFRDTAVARQEQDKEIRQFKETLDKTGDCIFMFDAEKLKFFYVNQGACQQVGYSHDELLTMGPSDIKPDFDDHGFRALIQPLISGELPSLTFETSHRHRDSTDIPVEIFLQFVRPHNDFARFVAIVRDITERRKIDLAKAEFLSTVSHELRTPLTSIKGSLGLVQAGALGDIPPEAKDVLGIAYRNSEQLVLLINDILDIEKIEAGKMAFSFERADIVALVDEAMIANKAYGAEYNATFQRSGDKGPLYVVVDPARMMQVFSNLLSNAAKFSLDDDAVIVHISATKDQVIITVSNHGPGIQPEFCDKVFSRFTQADSSDTRKVGGTGLGLSITKVIVEQMGGGIGFSSTPNEVTTFYIELPRMMS